MGRGRNFLKGFVIGATMTVPGASGGTMAMLLGIYKELLDAAADFYKDTASKLRVLLPVAAGGALGALLMAGQIERLLLFFPVETGGFFAGMIVGGVPFLLRKAAGEKKTVLHALWLLPGAAVGMLLPLCPALFIDGEGIGYRLLFLPAAGMLLAAALVLPGISASAFLYIFGLYERTLSAVRARELGFLLPLAGGCTLGICLSARLIRRILEKYPADAEYVMVGFLIASAPEAVGRMPEAGQWGGAALLFILGMMPVLVLSLYEAGWRPPIGRKGKKHGSDSHGAHLRRKGARSGALQGVAGDLSGQNQR